MAKGRFFVTGVKYGMKYGPHAKLLFDQVKEPAADYARARLESQRARRLALTKARTLQDGSVLEVVHGQVPVWRTSRSRPIPTAGCRSPTFSTGPT